MAEFIERRRAPRVRAEGGLDLTLRRRVRVSIVDVSVSGALLASAEPLPAGSSGRLTVRLGAVPFEAPIEVRRDVEGPDGGRLAGVRFGHLPAAHREVLGRFLEHADESS